LIPKILLQNAAEAWDDPLEYRPSRFVKPISQDDNDAPGLRRRASDLDKETAKLLEEHTKSLHHRQPSVLEREPVEPTTAPIPTREHNYPFGFGRHTCLGRPYALWVMVAILEAIFEGFDVEIDDPEGLFEKRHPYQRIRPHIYSFPRSKVFARLTPRHKGWNEAVNSVMRKEHLAAKTKHNVTTLHQHFAEQRLHVGQGMQAAF